MSRIVDVMPKPEILDPQGQAIQGSLSSLGFTGVGGVRQGKIFDVDLDVADASQAESDLRAMCEKLLANTVIESYRIEVG